VLVRYVGERAALPGAEPVEPTLEDAYLLSSVDARAGDARPRAVA